MQPWLATGHVTPLTQPIWVMLLFILNELLKQLIHC